MHISHQYTFGQRSHQFVLKRKDLILFPSPVGLFYFGEITLQDFSDNVYKPIKQIWRNRMQSDKQHSSTTCLKQNSNEKHQFLLTVLFPTTAFSAAGAKRLQYLQRLAIQTCGKKGTKDNMRQGGKDSLQSEVIHSHPGVVNVKKHPVQVHICTNNLQGRGQMLISQLSFQSDTQTEGRNPCALIHSRVSLRQACPVYRGCTEREFIVSS